MRTYVAVTDDAWFRYLADRPHLTEANFWLPGGTQRTFGAVAPGEPMLFKTHHPHNRIVGGGWLSDYRRLPLSLAWDCFGEANGCGSLPELRTSIGRYRKEASADPETLIGCVMLRDTVFYPPGTELPAPDDFAKNIVRGKGYELGSAPPEIEAAFARLVGLRPTALDEPTVDWFHHGPMFGQPRPVAPRLGQQAFAAVVGGAYGMKCAVTGDKVRPVLQAAHIRPVAREGQHRVDNGLLLRADVHILYDQGFLGVHPERHELQVSSRLRDLFDNGREFYALKDSPIGVPDRVRDRPNAEFLAWHLDEVFQP